MVAAGGFGALCAWFEDLAGAAFCFAAFSCAVFFLLYSCTIRAT